MNDIINNWLTTSSNNLLLYGIVDKLQIIDSLIMDGKNIIFACASYNRVELYMKQFKRYNPTQINDYDPIRNKLIICTFNMVNILALNDSDIVIYDNTSIDDHLRIKVYNIELNGEVIEIDGNKYFTKPEKSWIGNNTCRKIFTTTDDLVKRAIQNRFNVLTPDIYENLNIQNLTVIRTKFTGHSLDGGLLPIDKFTEKKHPHIFIGDGLGLEYNLVHLTMHDIPKTKNILCKVSQNHPGYIRLIADDLGISMHEVKEWLCIDNIHQLVNIIAGTRTELVVLIDNMLFKGIMSQLKYTPNKIIDITNDECDCIDTFGDMISHCIKYNDEFICGELFNIRPDNKNKFFPELIKRVLKDDDSGIRAARIEIYCNTIENNKKRSKLTKVMRVIKKIKIIILNQSDIINPPPIKPIPNSIKTYCVYAHINKVNNARYIGITTNFVKRNLQHIYNSTLPIEQRSAFGNAVSNIGWQNFEHRIVAMNLTKTDALRLELILIHHYDTVYNGYNVSNGHITNHRIRRLHHQPTNK